MNFYRVCHSHITSDRGFFIGPYAFNLEYISKYGYHDNIPKNPKLNYYAVSAHNWPVEINGKAYNEIDFLCGFSCLQDLRKWFTNKALRMLNKNQFVIRKYNLNHIVEGKEQAFALVSEIVHQETWQKCERI